MAPEQPIIADILPPLGAASDPAPELRAEVRAFLAEELAAGCFTPHCDSWLSGWEPAFSQKLAARGWVGMTFPKRYGGGERSGVDRFVVTEELLAAGAPVAAHWISDRQIGPSLLRYGTEEQKERFLPGIASATHAFVLGMSEPDAGSDLASVRTAAKKTSGGWELTGTKLWTSGAHRAQHIVCLTRTGPAEPTRHHGLTQLLVDLSAPGVTINPVIWMSGEHDFNEVVFEGVFVPDDMVLGDEGAGWTQVTSELAFERSGPERFLSTWPLLAAILDALRKSRRTPDVMTVTVVGDLISRLTTLRNMSLAIASSLDSGSAPEVAAALVKDLGTTYEGDVVEAASTLMRQLDDDQCQAIEPMLREAQFHVPGFTLRGGTTEILRGVIARAVGVR